jgi:acetyltransferase EpsM
VSIPITIPLINPNEPEALLAALHVLEGDEMSQGDPICTLETTKATAELEAEADGFIVGLRFSEGDTVNAGDLLCYLAENPNWVPPEAEAVDVDETDRGTVPEGVRVTRPALKLSQQHNLDLGAFPPGTLITENMVREVLAQSAVAEFTAPGSAFDPTEVIIYGGGGHGKACLELLRALRTYRVVGFVDDGLSTNETIMGVPVLGGGEVLAELYARGVRLCVNAVGGIGNLGVRARVFQRIAESGIVCPVVVHPTAYVESSASLSPGVQVFPHAYIGSEARVGFGGIVNTGAIVSHDCDLGECVNISPGAILAGEVQVGAGALIGMGVTINLRVRIGARARVGNGATVKSDVPDGGVVRAGMVWPP